MAIVLLPLHHHSVSELLFQGRDERGSTPSLHLCHIPGVTSQIMAVASSPENHLYKSLKYFFDVYSELIASKIILPARDCPR